MLQLRLYPVVPLAGRLSVRICAGAVPGMSPADFQALPALTNLEHLELGPTPVGADAALAAFSSLPKLRKIDSVTFAANSLSSVGRLCAPELTQLTLEAEEGSAQ